MKDRKKTIRTAITICVLSLLALSPFLFALGKYYLAERCVVPEISMEIGSSCPAVTEFLNWEVKDACFVSGAEEGTLFEELGDSVVSIRVYGREMESVVHVVDTVAPTVVTADQTIYADTPVTPEDFIQEIEDLTDTSVRFREEPDNQSGGIQTVALEVEDEGGNVTEAEAQLEVILDTEPPVISGVEEITIYVGDSVSYKKGVTVTDNCAENPTLEIDVDEVDTSTAGDYAITYRAVDDVGNETVVESVLHVKTKVPFVPTEEYINAEADKVLASILTDSMSLYEKASAIYWWCHDRIAYVNGASKAGYLQGAYQGLVSRKGDCYTYAMTAKCLLTRAGITNMDIERIPGNTMHYWNLIDIGEGWYHFDTCRRSDGTTFFYVNDATITAYSDAHNGTHNYDRSLYPTIQ